MTFTDFVAFNFIFSASQMINAFLGVCAFFVLRSIVLFCYRVIWVPVVRERQRRISIQAFEDRSHPRKSAHR